MKKRDILLSVLYVSLMLFVISCNPDDKKIQKNENATYLLTKTKEIIKGQTLDFKEIKYSSTDPVVMSEYAIFSWAQSSSDEGLSIDSKFIFKNIVRSSNQITLDVELLESDGGTSPYCSYAITLNNDGYMQKADMISKSSFIEDTEFKVEYNSDWYLTKMMMNGDDENSIITFAYDGGNIGKVSYDNGSGVVANCMFSGYDTENKGGVMHPSFSDYDGMFDIFVALNVLGKQTKMLPTESDWGRGGVNTYIYEKDANGCISKSTSKSEDDGEKFVYTYEYIEVLTNKK